MCLYIFCILQPIAKLVRLAFHDCVEKCDGCLNLDNPSNGGLDSIFSEVNDVYDNGPYRDSGMSRADFIALAGITAVYAGASQQYCRDMGMPAGCMTPSQPQLVARYGREDCSTSPVTSAELEFPDAHGDLTHVLSYFGAIGMTDKQIVALIGAHSLGDANPENSGFIGPWTSPRDVLDNKFFMALIRPPSGDWFQIKVNFSQSPVAPQPRYQWVTRSLTMGMLPRIMMLNTDLVREGGKNS